MRPLVPLAFVILISGCFAAPSSQHVANDSDLGTGGTSSHGGTDVPASGDVSDGVGSGGGDSDGTAGSPAEGTDPTRGGGGGVQAGILTAGAWDDNLNFDFYSGYLATQEAAQIPGLPLIPRGNGLIVTVADDAGSPVAGAHVVASHAGTTLLDTTTGADGRVLLFPSWAGLQHGDEIDLAASENGASNATTTVAGATEASLTLPTGPAVNALDVAFVVDVTGSMGDELAYLQAEADAISQNVAAAYPNVAQHWALVVYRDRDCNPWVEQRFDFSDVTTFQHELANYSADGGCDYPESPDVALKAAAEKLTWGTGATARLLFHVADAPHHAGDEGTVIADLAELRAKGVHVYPIQASGADTLTEFTMRTEAEVTGGSFLFLTDDSGIGDGHEVPTLPCFLVTKLDAAITRMITMELTGAHLYPTADQVLRTGGDPQNDACQLPDGSTVQVF